MNSPQTRAQITLSQITGHLWAGKRDDALAVVAKLISVTRSSEYQRKANGAGYELSVDAVLGSAFGERPLGAPEQTFSYDSERRWLGRARRLATKHGLTVVRKWQNRLIFASAVERGAILALAGVLAGWIVDEFEARFVRQVEDAVITLVGDRGPFTNVDRWHLYLDDGREVTPPGREFFASFLDAVFVATEIKHGTPAAYLSRRPYLWGTL